MGQFFVSKIAAGVGIAAVLLALGTAARADEGSADDLTEGAYSSTGEYIEASGISDALRSAGISEGTEGTGDLGDLGGGWSYDTPVFVGHEPGQEPAPDVSARSVIGSDNRTQVIGPTGKYAKLAFVQISAADYSVVGTCTGFLVAANYMLTAGHCLHPGGTGSTYDFYSYLDIFPSYDANGAGGGVRCYDVEKWAGQQWVDSANDQHDWGLVKLSCNAGSTFGTLGIATNSAENYYNNDPVTVAGYPGDKAEGEMWTADGTITFGYPLVLRHTADTAAGESGAPMFISNTAAAGIHAYGVGTFPDNHGTRFTQSLHDLLFDIMF